MIKRNNNTKPGKSSLAKVFLILFSLICLFITGISVVSADDAVYSTVGGTWVKVNEKTWTMDKDGDGKTDVTLIKEGDEWRYIFNVADDSSMYYGWETDIPDGYQVENGYGTKENPAVSIQYAHTPNIDNDGVQNGNYTGGVDTNKVFSVPGSSTIMMKLTADLAVGDYLVIWTGNHPDYTAAGDAAKGTKITGKIDAKEYTFNDNTITVGFHSEKDGEKGYGYYAVINSDKNQNGLMATNVATDEPIPDTGNLIVTKKVTESDGTESIDNNVFKFDIEFTSDNAGTTAALAEKKAYGDVTVENCKGSFYLSNGQQVKMTGLPAGISYKITEAENTDYEVSWTADSGVITKDAEATAVCVNKKKPKKEVKRQSLTVKKEVKETKNGADENFVFHTAFEGLEENAEYKYKKGEAETVFSSDETGAADVSFELKDKESIIFEGLPVGSKYQITEDGNSYAASYELTDFVNVVQQKQNNDEVNKSLSTGTEIVDADENAVVTFINTGKEPDVPETKTTKIRIKKVWNDNESKTRPAAITIYLMQDENIIKNITLNNDNGWQADFDGLDVFQEDGTTEYKYSVQEEKIDGYTSDITESTVDENGENIKLFTVTNTAISTGAIKVTKVVEGEKAETDKAFKFSITLQKDGQPVTGVYNLDSKAGTKTGTIALDENGKASFELKHNESIVISGLPIGASYEIAENPYKYYTASDEGKYSGVIPEGTAEVNVVNTHKEMYSISVTKTVRGNQGDKTKEFDFVLKLTAGDGIELPTTIEYKKGNESEKIDLTNGEAAFKLAHGEKITFKDLPAGIGYEVTESGAENDGYTVNSENASGVVKADMNVSFVNTKNVGIPTSSMTNTIVMLLIACIAICGVVYGVRKRR